MMMIKKPLKTTLLLALLTLAACTCKSQFSESSMLPQAGFNGGFEINKDYLPVNWYVYTPKTVKHSDFTIGFDTADKAEGKQSLKFDVKKCVAVGGHFSPGLCKEIAVKAGATYKVTFNAKNTHATCVFTTSAVSAFKKGEEKQIQITETAGQWKTYSFLYTVPDNFSNLRIEFSILQPGVVLLDDVEITLLSATK